MKVFLHSFLYLSVMFLAFGEYQPAHATPFAQYSVRGVLVQAFPGQDPNDLVGAIFEARYEFDMAAAPVVASSGPGFVTALHVEDAITVSISGRPNAAEDFSFMASAVDGAITYNRFSPSSLLDELVLGHVASSVTETPLGKILLPLVLITFNDQSVIPGTGAGPLPSFQMSDISGWNVGALLAGGYRYRLNVSHLSGNYIPEPPGLALLAVGSFGLLLAKSRFRQRPV